MIWTPRPLRERLVMPARQRGFFTLPGGMGMSKPPGGGGGGGGDPHFASVSLLLHMNGTDTSTTFTDTSPSPKTMTANGNAQIDTAQSKYGGASGLFDGSGDWISTPSGAAFNFGAGNFTIECFARPAAVASRMLLAGQTDSGTSAASTSVVIETTAAAKFRCYAYSGASVIWDLTGATTLSGATWYHFAVSRNGTDIIIYVNGVGDAAAAGVSAAVNSSSATYSIGRLGEFNGLYWNGHVDEFRVTKGVARYTANFTPPAAEFPDS